MKDEKNLIVKEENNPSIEDDPNCCVLGDDELEMVAGGKGILMPEI